MIGPQYFLHAANVLAVISFSVKDILWLRIFALCALFTALPYYYFQAAILWEPIGWTAVFVIVNGYHVWRLWSERRPIELSADEAKLYNLTFFPLSRRRFVDLVRRGYWADMKAGDVLIHPGQPIEEVSVPLTESIDVKVKERVLGRFAAGEIVGASAIFGARGKPFEAVACENCRVLRLPLATINRLAKRDDQLARTLERIAREDHARKLEHLLEFAATLPVSAVPER